MKVVLPEQVVSLVATLASEWFKSTRRLSRLTQEAAPARAERERAQLAYSRRRVEELLAQSGLRMVTHEGVTFTGQLPAEPANPEDFDTDEGLIVTETLEPTFVCNGRIVLRGRVVLGKEE